MARISVIIPIYNLAEFLPRCLDSVLAQTWSDLEIIAVDDGSTDNSYRIMQEYEKKDQRVKAFSKANGGVSSARNFGLERACGEYIYFLDGDDYISPDAFEKMMAHDCFDIVQSGYVEKYSDGKEVKVVDFRDETINDNDEILKAYFLNVIQESCWGKLYTREVIGDVRFDERMAFAEDSKFVYAVLKKMKSIKLISDITYYYFMRDGSCIHSGLKERDFALLDLRYMQYGDICENKNVLDSFVNKYSFDLFSFVKRISLDESGEFEHRMPEIKARLLKERKRIFGSKSIRFKRKAETLIFWLLPSLYLKIYRRARAGRKTV